jgi:outer membrane protein assembly factor BamB
MPTDQPQPSESPNQIAIRPRRRTPSRGVWFALMAIGFLVVIVRGVDLFGDHAIANIVTLVLCFGAFMTLAVWFCFFSAHSRLSRLLVGAGCLVVPLLIALLALGILIRIDRLSGDLIPTLAFSFSAKPDRLLPSLPADAGKIETPKVNLVATTDNDFPGFLGRRRDEAVDNVRLGRDWSSQPPTLVWRQKIGAGWSAFSVVNGHAVTMEQRGNRESTTCYSVETGKLEWSHSTEERFERIDAGVGPQSTPTIDEGLVFSLGALGHLACLDGATGKALWEKDLLQEFGISRDEKSVPWGRSASPLVVGQQVIVPVGGPKAGPLVSLAAFDKRTGALLWKGGESQISYSSPRFATLAGVEQILIVNEHTASGHDVKTGEALWECDWPGHSNRDPNVSQAVPVSTDRVLLSKGYGGGAKLLKLELADGGHIKTREVWKKPHVLKTKMSNVALRDGYAYGLSDGTLECVDLRNGDSKWRKGRYGHGQILRVADLLLVLSEDGELALVEATPERANHVLGRLRVLEGLTWNNLALFGPYLLVRNAEEAACYKLPLQSQ